MEAPNGGKLTSQTQKRLERIAEPNGTMTRKAAHMALHFAAGHVILSMAHSMSWALHERQAVGYTTRKGVLPMRITLHIGRFTVTIIVKSRNRHSAK